MEFIVTILTLLVLCLFMNTTALIVTFGTFARFVTTTSDEFIFIPTVTDTVLDDNVKASFIRWGFWGIGFMVGELDGFEE